MLLTFVVSCVIVVRSSAAASQLSASVLLNCVVKYSLSELPQLNNPNIVIEPELKAVLGRLRLLRTVSWRSNTAFPTFFMANVGLLENKM